MTIQAKNDAVEDVPRVIAKREHRGYSYSLKIAVCPFCRKEHVHITNDLQPSYKRQAKCNGEWYLIMIK
jgi:hypothetical protein